MVTVKKHSPKKKPVKRTRRKGVLSRIAPISMGDGVINLNIYGRSGTGKTVLACTAPKKLLLIGAEDGTKSVHNVKGVDFIRIETIEEYKEVITFLREEMKYKTAVLDTATSLQDMALKEILGIDQLPAQRSWGMATREQWGQCALQTKEMLRAIIDTPINTIIVAQEREFNSDSEDSAVIMPYVGSALSPSVTGWLNPACDYIVQSFIREGTATKEVKLGKKMIKKRVKTGKVQFCIRTAPDAVYTTKFRVPKGTPLPDVIVDPTFDKIMKLIEGK